MKNIQIDTTDLQDLWENREPVEKILNVLETSEHPREIDIYSRQLERLVMESKEQVGKFIFLR